MPPQKNMIANKERLWLTRDEGGESGGVYTLFDQKPTASDGIWRRWKGVLAAFDAESFHKLSKTRLEKGAVVEIEAVEIVICKAE